VCRLHLAGEVETADGGPPVSWRSTALPCWYVIPHVKAIQEASWRRTKGSDFVATIEGRTRTMCEIPESPAKVKCLLAPGVV